MVSLDIVSPLKLYFNGPLIFQKHQYWRLLTCLFYKGDLSAHTIFDFFMFMRYSGQLEKGTFRNKPAEFIIFLIFGCMNFLIFAYLLGFQFISSCLSTMMLYLWARKNPNNVMNFFDVFQFRSCFLPYFMLSMIVISGYDPTMDILGSLVGHIYYFLEDIVPHIPETQDYRVLEAP